MSLLQRPREFLHLPLGGLIPPFSLTRLPLAPVRLKPEVKVETWAVLRGKNGLDWHSGNLTLFPQARAHVW